jgi:hypothetical protein
MQMPALSGSHADDGAGFSNLTKMKDKNIDDELLVGRDIAANASEGEATRFPRSGSIGLSLSEMAFWMDFEPQQQKLDNRILLSGTQGIRDLYSHPKAFSYFLSIRFEPIIAPRKSPALL